MTLHEEDPGQPDHSLETALTTERLTNADNDRKEITMNRAGKPSPMFVSVRVWIDAEVPSGLYDDSFSSGCRTILPVPFTRL